LQWHILNVYCLFVYLLLTATQYTACHPASGPKITVTGWHFFVTAG